MDDLKLREYTFLGTTQSLCPECRSVVPAKIVNRNGRVYFRKHCPEHGTREDFICSDVNRYDQMQFAVPAKVPREFGVEPEHGCPLDCGLCTEHEQHTCIGLVELTSSCNLSCPMCYAESGAGGHHLSFADCCQAIDRLVEVEGRPEVLQLSGGEPTIHPQFAEVLEYALQQPIDYVMINTNGIRLAHDLELVQLVAKHQRRVEVYFQFDGLDDAVYEALRGEPLLKIKLQALEALEAAGVNVTLVATLQPAVNDDQLGALVDFALKHTCVSGLSLQPATYSGRHLLPEQLDQRLTFPEVIDRISDQTDGLFSADDFLPLPCAHPNCHSVAYAYRTANAVVPLTRFIDARHNLQLLANGISFRRAAARDLIEQYLGDQGCCGGGRCRDTELVSLSATNPRQSVQKTRASSPPASSLDVASHAASSAIATEFFQRALGQDLGARDVFRITITSFLDAYNFDVRRVMKCCTHHILPSGHVMGVRIKTGDTFAMPVAVAVAIGRVSCFVGGCCYGKPTTLPWGVAFPMAMSDPHVARHPTQLYEAAFHAAMAAWLLWLQRRGMFQGQLIKLYILAYLAYRFATEFIRPEIPLLCGLTGYQWAAVVLVPLFGYLWYQDAERFREAQPLRP